jgi:hypothetical protein
MIGETRRAKEKHFSSVAWRLDDTSAKASSDVGVNDLVAPESTLVHRLGVAVWQLGQQAATGSYNFIRVPVARRKQTGIRVASVRIGAFQLYGSHEPKAVWSYQIRLTASACADIEQCAA